MRRPLTLKRRVRPQRARRAARRTTAIDDVRTELQACKAELDDLRRAVTSLRTELDHLREKIRG